MLHIENLNKLLAIYFRVSCIRGNLFYKKKFLKLKKLFKNLHVVACTFCGKVLDLFDPVYKKEEGKLKQLCRRSNIIGIVYLCKSCRSQ